MGPVGMVVPVAMPMMMAMAVIMVVPVMVMAVPLDPAVSAAANRAHQMTSMSLILISSPPSGISLPPPQRGQGSSRWSISTVSMQS